jgi:hypothetical protein
MRLLNLKLAFASLIPDFIYQFLSTEYTSKEGLTCLELEDVKLIAQKRPDDAEMESIRKFLESGTVDNSEENSSNPEDPDIDIAGLDKRQATIGKMLNDLDPELEAVDDELYHVYTPGELRFIFEKITDQIDKIYFLNKKETESNLTLTITFKVKAGEQGWNDASLVIEFFDVLDYMPPVEDAFVLPIEKPNVSDSVVARVYIYYDTDETAVYEAAFGKIINIMNLKGNEGLH